MIKRWNIPKTLIYAKAEDETYGADIFSDYNLAFYDVFNEQVLRNQTVEIYLFDVEKQTYEQLFTCKLGLEIHSVENTVTILTDEMTKQRLKDAVAKAELPELNISDEVEKFNQVKRNAQLKKYKIASDRIFQESLKDRVCQWREQIYETVKRQEPLFQTAECALTLDSQRKMERFLESGIGGVAKGDDCFTKYWYDKFVSRIYIGSQFCLLKSGGIDTMYRMIKKCFELGKHVTVNTPFLTESSLSGVRELIAIIHELKLEEEFNGKIEITVNDYATIKILQEYPGIKKNLGVLLNRRQKDPRFSYRWGAGAYREIYRKNAIAANHVELFERFYEQFETIEYENNEIGNCYGNFKNTLHFPLYQTNTSRYCPMNADFVNHESDRQSHVKACAQYCDDYCYQYADEMPLVGIGNSNFGICTELAEAETGLREGKIHRLVWDFL